MPKIAARCSGNGRKYTAPGPSSAQEQRAGDGPQRGTQRDRAVHPQISAAPFNEKKSSFLPTSFVPSSVHDVPPVRGVTARIAVTRLRGIAPHPVRQKVARIVAASNANIHVAGMRLAAAAEAPAGPPVVHGAMLPPPPPWRPLRAALGGARLAGPVCVSNVASAPVPACGSQSRNRAIMSIHRRRTCHGAGGIDRSRAPRRPARCTARISRRRERRPEPFFPARRPDIRP